MSILLQYNQVVEFMELAGQTVHKDASTNTYKVADFRKALIKEELFGDNELCDSMRKDDRKGVLDGICDVLYVVYGALATYGMPVPDVTYTAGIVNEKYPTAGTSYRVIKNLTGYFEQYERAAFSDNNNELYNSCLSLISTVYSIGESYGVDIVGGFDEVHSSNMSKFCFTEFEAQSAIDQQIKSGNSNYENAQIVQVGIEHFAIKRASDGKILKPTTFFEPNLEKFI